MTGSLLSCLTRGGGLGGWATSFPSTFCITTTCPFDASSFPQKHFILQLPRFLSLLDNELVLGDLDPSHASGALKRGGGENEQREQREINREPLLWQHVGLIGNGQLSVLSLTMNNGVHRG